MTDAADRLQPRFNMAAYCIGRAASARADAPALIVVDDAGAKLPAEVWTFAGIEDACLRIAGGLRAAGLAPGARILIRLDNTSAYALLFFGAIAGGFVPLPTSAQLTEHEVRFLLEDSGAAAIAVGGARAIGAVPAGVRVFDADEIARMIAGAPRASFADTAADDPAFLVYT
jgi:acetyl-CoA synthetase